MSTNAETTGGLMEALSRHVRELSAEIGERAVVRGDEVIMPRGATAIEAQDRVVIFAAHGAVKKVEKLFSVALGFF